MNFWIFAVALLVIPAIIISWPFFSGSTRDRITGMFVLLMIPLAGLLLYLEIGTPDAISHRAAQARQQQASDQPHSSQQGQMEEVVAGLQQRLAENGDDPEGWLILGRTLKTMQRYAEAETALGNAYRLLPDNPMVMVELAETRLFASGQRQISAADRQLLETAIAIDPQQQKGLWLLGIAATQQGDDVKAVEVWQKLLVQLDPASDAAQTVTQQIETAQARLGQPVAAVSEKTSPGQPVATVSEDTGPVQDTASGFEIPVSITLAEELGGRLPGNATLFVFIHPAGARGMPLAVKRSAVTGFPVAVQFSDADTLQPGASLENFEQLDISARISMSGIANRASGDYQSVTTTFATNSQKAIALHIDQRVP